ncbi:MAG: ABC transporter substrate-binding protein [Chloroflexi bacterium]|nr:ABC transporter substrate-binding protein [Chloroflexota bacterium]
MFRLPATAAIALCVALLAAACAPAAPPSAPAAAPAAPAPAAPTSRPTPSTPRVASTPAPSAPSAPAQTARPAETVKRGGTLNIPHRDEPAHLDFHLTSVAGSRIIIGVYSRLIRPEMAEGKTQPFDYVPQGDLAERWEQSSPTTWIFYLRKNAKFHNTPPVNGRPVTAGDVVWSFQRAVFTKGGAQSGIFETLKSVERVDDHTVKFTLKSPDTTFFDNLMSDKTVVVAPKEVVEKEGDLKRTTIGSGPWIFKGWVRGSRITVVRNPDSYLSGEPFLDQMNFILLPDQQTSIAAFKAGRLDLIDPSVKSQVNDILRSLPAAKMTSQPSGPSWLFARADLPPTKDVRVRRALSMAINRQRIIDTVLEGEGEVTSMILSAIPDALPKSEWGEAGKNMAYNPGEAKRLLQEAGYKKEKVGLWQTPAFGAYLLSEGEAIAEDFRQVGVNAESMVRDYATFITTSYGGKYENLSLFPQVALPFWHNWVADYLRTGGRVAVTKHSDAQLDEVIDKARTEMDPAKRRQYIREALRINMERVYTIPIVAGRAFTIRQPYVRNWVEHYDWRTSSHHTRVWLDR